MRKTKRNRGLLLTGAAAAAIALLGMPHDADAKSRRQISKPGDVQPGDRVAAGPQNKSAPEIDPNTVASGLALAAGGLAVLGGRRRTRKNPAR